MSSAPQRQSYIVFPLGERSFALPADAVVELARSGTVQEIPHTTPFVSGVLVRRGLILPVWDVSQTLIGSDLAVQKFYLVVLRHFGAAVEWVAIPVSGECQMVQAERVPVPAGRPSYVCGTLSLESGSVEVLDLEALAVAQRTAPAKPSPGGTS